MPQLFQPSANALAKVSIVGGLFLADGLFGLLIVFGCNSYATRVQEFVEQPLQFSHACHVGDDDVGGWVYLSVG